jgi:predicted extracellular nuclease
MFAVLDSSVNPMFNDTKNCSVLAQSFVENATGAVFTSAVNHLKSKGSSCDDIGDPTGSGSGNVLITGDLNAYAMEDPVSAIEGAGYTDLIESFLGSGFSAGAYSFNFFSESGYLDHGLASASLTPQVAGAAFWHVNADEPRGLDYNDFNQPGLFNPDEFRSSDHDPVLVGLQLYTPKVLKEMARDDLEAALPTGNRQDDKFIGKAINRIEQSLNPDG